MAALTPTISRLGLIVQYTQKRRTAMVRLFCCCVWFNALTGSGLEAFLLLRRARVRRHSVFPAHIKELAQIFREK